eukprot:GABV01005748.1.p1 GENE.GABV01005748.1~~GABV01005748.1.p1  ORF type:complete len:104 (-),score=26.24 GABV01005748.1:3-314(-)
MCMRWVLFFMNWSLFERPEWPGEVSASPVWSGFVHAWLKQIIGEMICLDPSRRPTASEILERFGDALQAMGIERETPPRRLCFCCCCCSFPAPAAAVALPLDA